jgi:HlyD family secretion protein
VRWIRLLAALACVGVAIWQTRLLLDVLGGGADAPVVETAVVQRGPFAVGFTRDATLASADIVQVSVKGYGSRITWLIDDGAKVKKGDLIAKLDVSEYETQLATQRLQYQEAKRKVQEEKRERTRDYESADMDVEKNLRALDVLGRSQLTETEQGKAQTAFDLWNVNWSKTDFDKQSRLSREGIVPVTTMEQSERQLRSREFALARSQKNVSYLDAQHSLKRAQAGTDVDNAKFAKDLAKRRIGEAVSNAEERARIAKRSLYDMETKFAAKEVRAPKDGVVVLGETWGEEGRRALRAGDEVWRAYKICDITELALLDARLRVEETMASRLTLGQEAQLTVQGLPKRVFKAKVTGIGAISREVPTWEDPNATPGEHTVDVTVRLINPDTRVLRPGIKARVQIVFRRIPEATYIPLQAAFDEGRTKIAYLQRGARFLTRPMTVGARNDEAVQVTAGLRPGDRVALSNPTRAEKE